MKENIPSKIYTEDFIIPLIYDVIIRNILKQNKDLLVLIINNVLETEYKKENIYLKDVKLVKRNRKEKQRECDILVEIKDKVINIEINKYNTKSLDDKNMSYVGKLLESYYESEVVQININDFDIYGYNEEIYVSSMVEEKHNIKRTKKIKIYDINIDSFKEKCYTNSRRYDKDFVLFMQIIKLDSKKKIESKIKNSKLLWEVYEMQDKLSREDFVLERFPDDLFNEMEKKELRQKAEDSIKEGFKEGMKEGMKEGIETNKKEIVINLLKKNFSYKEIEDIVNISEEKIKQIEKSIS